MRIIAFSSLINSITGLNGSVLTTSHKYFVGAFLLVILLVSAVLLNWVLIPIYGLNGAALATCLAVIFFNLLKYFYILYRYKMQPFDLKIFVIITFGLVVTFITTLIPSMTNIWLDLIIRGLLMVVPYCLFLLYLQPVKEIVKLNSIIRTKILRR
jgi:O-antigen/teichoic acid export membrane protein